MRIKKVSLLMVVGWSLACYGCGGYEHVKYHSVIGPDGGSVEGPDNTVLQIPQGALRAFNEIYILENKDVKENDPENTIMIFDVGPEGLVLNKKAAFMVPDSVCNNLWVFNSKNEWQEGAIISKGCPQNYLCIGMDVLQKVACIGKGEVNEGRK